MRILRRLRTRTDIAAILQIDGIETRMCVLAISQMIARAVLTLNEMRRARGKRHGKISILFLQSPETIERRNRLFENRIFLRRFLLVEDAMFLVHQILAPDAVATIPAVLAEEEAAPVLAVFAERRSLQAETVHAFAATLAPRDAAAIRAILRIIRLVAVVRIFVHDARSAHVAVLRVHAVSGKRTALVRREEHAEARNFPAQRRNLRKE